MLQTAISTSRIRIALGMPAPNGVAKVNFLGTYIENGPIIYSFLSLLVPLIPCLTPVVFVFPFRQPVSRT